MANPLVSVLIPSFNAGSCLGETIGSVFEQTWPRKEVIIVDDGSTDDSLRIARGYESKYVKVIAQENRGGPAARNRALEHAQGDYLQWLDADDILHPDKIRLQIDAARRASEPTRTVFTGPFGRFFFRPCKAAFEPNALWQDLSPVEWMSYKFREQVWMNPAVWLLSRELVDQAGPWDETLVRDQDGEYICRVISRAQCVKYVAGSTSFYRRGGPTQVSARKTREACQSTLRSAGLCIDYLLRVEDTARTREACARHLQSVAALFYPDHPDLVQRTIDMAKRLGTRIEPPRVRAKYRWLVPLVSARNAALVSRRVAGFRWSLWRGWHRMIAQRCSCHRLQKYY